jgi:hypothetical protein
MSCNTSGILRRKVERGRSTWLSSGVSLGDLHKAGWSAQARKTKSWWGFNIILSSTPGSNALNRAPAVLHYLDYMCSAALVFARLPLEVHFHDQINQKTLPLLRATKSHLLFHRYPRPYQAELYWRMKQYRCLIRSYCIRYQHRQVHRFLARRML